MKFSINKKFIKLTAFVMCTVIATGSLTYVGKIDNHKIEAKTISELENEKSENEKEIEEKQKEIDKIKDDIKKYEEYQKELQKQIDLQNENIEIVNTQIETLNKEIKEKEEKIENLQLDINNKQQDINTGLEEFKLRLRAMYVNGNDSLASALVGSTDFYDMLSKIELISRVAKRDDDLINSLMTQLDQFEEAKAQLDIEKTNLDSTLAEQNDKKSEMNTYIKKLNDSYEETESVKNDKETKKNDLDRDVKQLEKDNKSKDSEISEIEAVIKRQQAAALAEQNKNNSSNGSSNSGSGGGSIAGSTGNGNYTGGTLGWPVPGFYYISSGYGYRWGSLHGGLDIAGGGINGANVVAAESGTVILVKTGCTHNGPKNYSCGCNGGYGNYLVIDHGNGLSTVYAHCSSVNVSVGQSVSRGQSIANAGSTGWSTGYHLHFEVRINGSRVNPASYLGR